MPAESRKSSFERSSVRVTIIAEVGSVHDGSLGNARKLVELAAEAGADVAKFQTHIASAETLRNAPSPPYFQGETRYEYFQRTGFSLGQWQEIKAECEGCGIEFMSSPFSEEAVALLEKAGVRRYKVGSGEVTNVPLLEAIRATGKPVIISSGMSSWRELDEAVECLRGGGSEVSVVQCTSDYPCPYEQAGLNVMAEMRTRYGLPVGISDHTLTPYASFAAVVLGAAIIEKHLTFSRRMYGSDARHSIEPDEFRELVQGIRAIEVMLASPVDKDACAEGHHAMKRIFEKSVVSLQTIPAGARIAPQMVAVKKPGTGIPARRLKEVIGRRAKREIPAETVLQEEDLDSLKE